MARASNSSSRSTNTPIRATWSGTAAASAAAWSKSRQRGLGGKKLKPRCDAPPETAAPIAAAVVTPQILTLAAIVSQRRGDGAGGAVGIRRLGDRPADDEDRGAGIERRLR